MPSILIDALFAGAVVCCAVAQVAIVRSTARATPRDARGLHRASEIAWAAIPAIALAAALLFTWQAMHPQQRTIAPSASGEVNL